MIPRWNDYPIPYNSVTFDAQVKCPRFPIFRKVIDTFKYSSVIRFVLRDDDTFSLEADTGTSRHFVIFKKSKVFQYPKYDQKFIGKSVKASIDYKKVSFFIHSLNFTTEVNLYFMATRGTNVKFFFRFRDDILAHFITPALFEENSQEINETDSD